MSAHYDLKRDAAGWAVFDRWTGRVVVIEFVPQVGLALAGAEAVVRKLNQGGDPDDRKILQMSPDQQHRCTVQVAGDGAPFLAFEPSTGEASPFSNSLFTLDLRAGVSTAEAQRLADDINSLMWGVSTTIF